MTDFYDISLALTTVFLLAALGWSVVLRRRIQEQTQQIRLQVEREAALENKYRDLFEQANDMVFSQDLSGKLTALNKAGERILGCTRERALRMHLREFVAPDQIASFQKWLERCAQTISPSRFELEVIGCNQARSIIEVSARPVCERDKTVGIEGIARDITEKKRAEEALRQSEERFSSAFRVSPVAIGISTLSDWCFIDVNESFLRLFGFQRQDVINHTATELSFWASPEDRSHIESTFRQAQSLCGVECKIRIKSGETRTTLLFAERINLGSVPCALIVIHDITERLRLEAQLRQALKMEAVGRLAAGIAHDFNNLLTIIQGNIDLTIQDHTFEPKVAGQLRQVSDASHRVGSLTRQLLTFSRQRNLQRKPMNLNEVVCNSIRMFKHLLRGDITLRVKFEPGLPTVNADPAMVEQVIMNLVTNARDAMSKGGDLMIGTTQVKIEPAYCQMHPEASVGSFVCLNVADTGCGMDAATQSRLFEPFFTTKEAGQGYGLGLATVYGVIKQHDGWIEVQSEVGQGSTFKVFIPAGQLSASIPRRQEIVPHENNQRTILVVENESALAELVRKVLEADGHRMLEAADSLVALQVWNDHNGQIDLVLTDIRTSQGMSGLDLAENLRALQPDVKVLFTASVSTESIHPSVFTQSNIMLLHKPYSPSELRQSVCNILGLPLEK